MEKKKTYSYDILDDFNTVASATECTGLIQIPPTNIEEAESYSAIYSVPIQINNLKEISKNSSEKDKEKLKAM